MATIEQDVVQHHENEFPPVLEITEGASLRLQSMMKERKPGRVWSARLRLRRRVLRFAVWDDVR
jgi:hypothetical protein